MLIKKCDRCGAVIEEKHQNIFAAMTDAINNAFGKPKVTYEIKKFDKCMLYDVDLCEDCQKCFNEWLQGGTT